VGAAISARIKCTIESAVIVMSVPTWAQNVCTYELCVCASQALRAYAHEGAAISVRIKMHDRIGSIAIGVLHVRATGIAIDQLR
jgi:hypothetical protein